MFAKLKNQEELIKREFKKGVRFLAYITVPLSFVVFLFSDYIVILLFSEKWLKSAYYLEILSFTIIPYILYYLNIDLFKSKGDSKAYMKINVYTKLIGILLIIISSFYGLKYVLYSFVFIHWLSYIYSTIMTERNINYGCFDQLKELIPFAWICILILGLILSFDTYYYIKNFHLREITRILIFCIVYFLLTYKTTLGLLRKILGK